MNPEHINIREYQAWRDTLRTDFAQKHADEWGKFLAGNKNVRFSLAPDTSIQAYVEHLLEQGPAKENH